MKLSSAEIEHTLEQFDAEVVPDDNPLIQRLQSLFGDHTYFLDDSGLNIVEPAEPDQGRHRMGVVVNIADWTDVGSPSLVPHEPEITDLFVDLKADSIH